MGQTLNMGFLEYPKLKAGKWETPPESVFVRIGLPSLRGWQNWLCLLVGGSPWLAWMRQLALKHTVHPKLLDSAPCQTSR